MTKKSTLIASTLIVALLGTVAIANAKGPMGGHDMRGPEQRISFTELDINEDGKVTQDELTASAETRFKAADTDGNGTLSADELVAAAQERALDRQSRMAKVMIAMKDANDDGVLDLEEMTSGPRGGDRLSGFFDRFDADDDGVVTEEEFDEARADLREKGRKGMKNRWMQRHGQH